MFGQMVVQEINLKLMIEDNSQRPTSAQQLQYNYLEQHKLVSVLSIQMFEGIQAQIENHLGDNKKVLSATESVG